jgi:hypothetical protein
MVEIPTPKLNIFLFLVFRSIEWYIDLDPLGQHHPQEREIAKYLENR